MTTEAIAEVLGGRKGPAKSPRSLPSIHWTGAYGKAGRSSFAYCSGCTSQQAQDPGERGREAAKVTGARPL